MVAQRAAALATAVRMVDGVHGLAARLRAHAQVALAAGLADRDVLVVGVADHADRRAAGGAHLAHLAGGQAQRRVVALLGHQLHADAGGARELRAAARLELDVVHQVPTGIAASGIALPTWMSAPAPEITVMPTRRRFGAMM